jgi:hypothetical protein
VDARCDDLLCCGHRYFDAAYLITYLTAEERACDNPQRQPRHLVLEIKALVRPPALQHLLGSRHDHTCVAGQTLTMEDRLYQAPLPAPERSLARKQTIADDGPETAVGEPLLAKARFRRDQDLFDERWVTQQHDAVQAEP